MVRPSASLIFAAACLGMFYAWIAVNFWGFYAANNPFNEWLLNGLAVNGHGTVYRLVIGAHDVVINILLAIPFAALLLVRSGLNSWTYAAVAAAAAVVFANWDTNWSATLITSVGFWMGFAMMLLSLPIAFAGVRAIRPPS